MEDGEQFALKFKNLNFKINYYDLVCSIFASNHQTGYLFALCYHSCKNEASFYAIYIILSSYYFTLIKSTRILCMKGIGCWVSRISDRNRSYPEPSCQDYHPEYDRDRTD